MGSDETDAVVEPELHDGWATSTDLFQLDVWMPRHADAGSEPLDE